MSEKIYALFLRLFPQHFKQSYGMDALQLFRDRLRDESGLIPRFRLWLDLLADLAVSLPREYNNAPAALNAAPAVERSNDVLSFRVLQGEPPRPEAFFFASLLSFAALGVFAIAIGHAGDYRPFRAFVAPVRATPHLRPAVPSHSAPSQGADGDEEAIGPSSQAADASALQAKSHQPVQAADANKPLTMLAANGPENVPASQARDARLPQPKTQQSKTRQPAQSKDAGKSPAAGPASQAANAPPLQSSVNQHAQAQDANKPLTKIAPFGPEIDWAEKQFVLSAAEARLRQHYFDRDVAVKMADALAAHAKNGEDRDGEDKDVQTGAGFATLLTRQMRDVSEDMDLGVMYSASVLPKQPSMTMSRADLARYRQAMEESKCTLEKVEMLPRNVGYLKINSFPDTSICGVKIASAMASLNGADAVIFDLRDNGGGQGNAVALMTAYLFDHPQALYSPRAVSRDLLRTASPVKGNMLAGKPVYLLVSGATASAAEDFAYNLKMLHRATLVGETTKGSAHAGTFYRIDDHFGMGIPEVKIANPYGKNDWEGVGVEPDVKVKAEDALATAERLAQSSLRKK